MIYVIYMLISNIFGNVQYGVFSREDCTGQFECDDGVCIPTTCVCDGARLCLDGTIESVEAGRNWTDIVECGSGQCITLDYVRDGEPDCRDGTDGRPGGLQLHGQVRMEKQVRMIKRGMYPGCVTVTRTVPTAKM